MSAAEGLSNTEIAEQVRVHRNTVRTWRAGFLAGHLGGLADEPLPCRPRTVTDQQVEDVAVKTLKSTPKDETHWSTRSMVEGTGMSQSAIHRIWNAFGLQPHSQATWKLSRDPQFVANPGVDRVQERQPAALRQDQDRRPDPRIHQPLLHTKQGITAQVGGMG
ncbi:helix-turn-helix domain-containing protein [Patulibacter sp. NPDC049589]|uniref:helix-turn-helix domain-containing protein n=1 Tax=Patulibacter sp. NPDC049589 TaxID=3154731 RepID=UPI0034232F34